MLIAFTNLQGNSFGQLFVNTFNDLEILINELFFFSILNDFNSNLIDVALTYRIISRSAQNSIEVGKHFIHFIFINDRADFIHHCRLELATVFRENALHILHHKILWTEFPDDL